MIAAHLFLVVSGALALGPAGRATAQETPVNIDDLFAPPAPEPAADTSEAAASEAAATAAAEADVATEAAASGTAATDGDVAPVVAQVVPPAREGRTLAESGGVYGLGLVIAPKIGGGLGSVFFEGLGAAFVAELELGYDLPLALPVARELELFASVGYAGPSTTATVPADDARLPGDGSFNYTLTLHELAVTTGVLYRVPIAVVDWWRLYAAAGLRNVWSATVVSGAAGGEQFGTYTETAFDLGGYGAIGSDFYVGPGAILVELQAAATWPNRFVLRETSTTAVQLAVGYRFFL